MPSSRKRVHVLVAGRVQGVAFRYYTRREALSLGLSGWVRNLADGRVEAVVEGPASDVEVMVEWIRRGPPGARVDGLEVQDEPPRGKSGKFEITF